MDSSALRDELQKLKDSGQLRANPIIIATVHATRRDSKTGIITIQTSGSFQSPTKTCRANHHGHADAVAQAIEWLVGEVLPDRVNGPGSRIIR